MVRKVRWQSPPVRILRLRNFGAQFLWIEAIVARPLGKELVGGAEQGFGFTAKAGSVAHDRNRLSHPVPARYSPNVGTADLAA